MLLEKKPEPKDAIVKTNTAFSALKAEADLDIRKRKLQLLHPSNKAELQTMINVFKKGTYVAPHAHWLKKELTQEIKKSESFLALEGTGKVLLFDDAGEIKRVIFMDAKEQTMVWIPAGVWHSVVCTSAYFIVFENKTGPWKEGEDKIFHPHFPNEGDAREQDIVKEWESLD